MGSIQLFKYYRRKWNAVEFPNFQKSIEIKKYQSKFSKKVLELRALPVMAVKTSNVDPKAGEAREGLLNKVFKLH